MFIKGVYLKRFHCINSYIRKWKKCPSIICALTFFLLSQNLIDTYQSLSKRRVMKNTPHEFHIKLLSRKWLLILVKNYTVFYILYFFNFNYFIIFITHWTFFKELFRIIIPWISWECFYHFKILLLLSF